MQFRSCLLLSLLLGWTHNLYSDVLYTATDLGTLGLDSSAGGMNNVGQVTGYSGLFNGAPEAMPHAFSYSNGQMRDLGTLGGSDSFGHAIDNAGQVTGYSLTTSDLANHAFLYGEGQMRDLGDARWRLC